MDKFVDKFIEFLYQLAHLDFIGRLIAKGVISSAQWRAIEASINSAEMALVLYLLQWFGTWIRSSLTIALWTFFTTIVCGLLSAYLIHLRAKKKKAAEILEIVDIDGAWE